MLEFPLLRSITALQPCTTDEIHKYAIRVVRQGAVSYKTDKDGVLLSHVLSDLVLKRCREYPTSQGDKKKLNKLRTKLHKLVCEPDIGEEAEKKGRAASKPSSMKMTFPVQV